MSDNHESQRGSRLLALPKEVRLLIYEHMFPHEKLQIYVIKGQLHKALDSKYPAGDHVAALSTCRALYTEAKSVLYANSEYHIHIQDNYMNHPANSATYRFSSNSVKWKSENSWLADLRSTITLEKAQRITIEIALHNSRKGVRQTWNGALRSELRGATSLKKLHVILKAPQETHTLDLFETDRTLLMLGHTVKCSGVVTAAMDFSLGPLSDFKSESYYEMLAALKGTDRTREVFSKKLGTLHVEHDIQIRVLEEKTQKLLDLTNHRISLAKDPIMRGYAAAQVERVAGNTETALRDLPEVENRIFGVKRDMEKLEEQLESLTTGSGMAS